MKSERVEHLIIMRVLQPGLISSLFTICLLTFGILLLFDSALRNIQRTRVLYVIGQCKSCEMGSALAESDFQKGSYLLVRWGLPETRSMVVGEVLHSDFGIDQLYGGCADRAGVDCYTDRMAELLLQKYGKDFYRKVMDKANRIYDERKKRNPLY